MKKLSLTFLSALVLTANATYNQVSDGVLRIELKKEYIPKMEYAELNVENDIITIQDNTYTQLRN